MKEGANSGLESDTSFYPTFMTLGNPSWALVSLAIKWGKCQHPSMPPIRFDEKLLGIKDKKVQVQHRCSNSIHSSSPFRLSFFFKSTFLQDN